MLPLLRGLVGGLVGRRARDREIAGGEPERQTLAALAGAVPTQDWFILWPALARAMEEQLAREILPRHKLEGRRLTAALKSHHSDDVVCFETDANGNVRGWWMVHLTWSRPVDERWPYAGAIDAPVAGKAWP
jgi:hypothetical protein